MFLLIIKGKNRECVFVTLCSGINNGANYIFRITLEIRGMFLISSLY